MTAIRQLRGSLVVSVQAWPGSALDEPEIIAALARAAAENGAAALRIDGPRNIGAVRKGTSVPIIGILKRKYEGYEPYITPTPVEVAALAAAGASIIAFDATSRIRPGGHSARDLVEAIHEQGLQAMADCSNIEDARAAMLAGAEIIATTLCGYTEETGGQALPALELVHAMRALEAFVICEGGIDSPAAAAAAFAAGADAIVVGTAITNVDALVRRFVAATPNAVDKSRGPQQQ